MAPNALTEAVNKLQEARLAQQQIVDAEQAKLAQFDQAIAQLQHTILVVDPEHMPKRNDYQFMGITEAVKRWLTEVGEARTNRDIAEELLARGIKTKSADFSKTVRSTLHNSDAFIRTDDGKWQLRRQG